MKPRLVSLRGSGRGREIALRPGAFTIGRADDCQLRPASPLVSQRHCELLVATDSVRLRDLFSRNGTCVNGQRVQGEVDLHDGDVLAVGPLAFRLALATSEPCSPPAGPTAAAIREAEFSDTRVDDVNTLMDEWVAEDARRTLRVKRPSRLAVPNRSPAAPTEVRVSPTAARMTSPPQSAELDVVPPRSAADAARELLKRRFG